MTETIRLTNSEMKGWRRCRRQWYLGTYRKLRKKQAQEFNRPLSIGSRIHDVLSKYYVPGVFGDRKQAWEFFDEQLEADKEAHPLQAEELDKEADLCRTMLEGYFEWLEETGEDSQINVIASESEMEQPLIDGATLLSKIDVRVERLEDNRRGALEHKTVGSLTDPVRRLQVDTQLLTEHLVEYLALMDEGKIENRAEFVLYNMMRKVKRTARANPPFYARETVRHNVDELRHHWKHCAQQAREIIRTRELLDAGADHHDVCYPSPTGDCTWDCPFSSLCLSGLMDDGSDWEAAVAADYEECDPLERYESK